MMEKIVEELRGIKGALNASGFPSDWWNWRVEVEKKLIQIATRTEQMDRKLTQLNRLMWGLVGTVLSYVVLQLLKGGFQW